MVKSVKCKVQRYNINIIGKIGTAGGTGYVIEYSGEAISNLLWKEG